MLKDLLWVNKILDNEETLLPNSLNSNDKFTAILLLPSPLLDLSNRDKNGNSYFHLALKQRIENITLIFLQKKFDINTMNNNGMSMLD